MKNKNSISIIIPCFRIKKNKLVSVIDEISKYFRNLGIQEEIIVSQNGMDKKFKIKRDKVKVVFDYRKGLGVGLRNGILEAKNEFCYFLPPDIPFKFTDFVKMNEIKNHYDLIIGSKLCYNAVYKASLKRILLSNIQVLVTKLLIPNFPVRDPNGTFFGKTSLLKKIIPEIKSTDYFFTTEMIFRFLKYGYEIVEVPVIYQKDDSLTTVNFVSDSLNYFKQLFWLGVRG